MRIAISGSHRAGKSTLVGELARRLPDHVAFTEPYELMLEEGYAFSDPPSLEDFEAQLERSLDLLGEDVADAIFDRSPLDFLGYLSAHPDGGDFATEDWMPRVQQATHTLDLIVFIPIEGDDRIGSGSPEEETTWREDVDAVLGTLFREESHRWGSEVLEVEGSPEARADAVLDWCGRREGIR